ncbi:MAG: T9SS type B sorting domain-containing protein, partial [Flavobacteriaceae bacterium]|nr:T9SS type B sorting domain-containing protein [Flavobacteriaceae bacterium]
LLFFISFFSYSQGEANNWYFGYGAGLIFDNVNNTVTPSDAAQNSIATFEGCSSISDPAGNLLFYSDGRDVWDANHQLMPNADYYSGSGLLGDPSSTSSAVIIPKPGDTNKYFIFTVDEPHHQNAWAYPDSGPAQEDGSPTFDGTYDPGDGIPEEDDGFNNGLNYSLVDMTLNGGMGDVDPSEKNIPLLTYNPNIQKQLEYKCAEKITAVEHADGQSYWVLTHFVNIFYAFRVDSNGVNTSPSISAVAPSISVDGYRRNGIGYIKSSPNGEKLAIAHSQNGNQEGGDADNGSGWVYDFNRETGQVTNPTEVVSNESFYGVAFSQNSEKVYFGSNSGVQQIDLTAVNITDSATYIYQDFAFLGAMQLAPNGKIYVCNQFWPQALDVIDNPNESAANVNYIIEGQPLSPGTQAGYGLPPFIQSFLVANISYVNDCLGSSTEFTLSTSETVISLDWDFGDSETSTEINPQHVYTAPGEYTASVVITTATETQTFETLVIIFDTPTANSVEDVSVCDDNNDGVNSFDFIADVTPTVLGTQDPLGFSVTYHPTQADADDNTNAYAIPYSNTLSQESVFVRIENVENTTCYDTTSFVIEVFDTPVPPVDFEYYQCDYTNSGDLTEVFDLVALNADIINGQDLTITHYETEADAQSGTNPIVGLYTNTSPIQTIYVLLVSNILSDCTAIGSYTIGVDPLPNVIVDVPLVQCDIDDIQDGISIYNLEEVGENVIIGDDASNYSLTFHLSQADLDAGINAIPDPTSYVNLTPLQTIYTRVENIATTCYTTSFFFLETIFNPIPDDAGLIVCDNSEGNGNDYDGLGLFTLSDANDYILSLIVANPDNDITSPDQLTISYYTSESDALLELNQLPNEYISEVANAQTLFLRVERGNDCFGINSMLLEVLPVPTYDEVPDEILCTYTPGSLEVDFVADYNPVILGAQDASEIIITYHTSQEDADTGINALPNPYTVVEQITVFVREEVQNNNPLVAACFITNVSFTLTVEPRPEFIAPIPLIVCDDDDVLDGLTTIDISVQTETIMAGFEQNVVTYHVSEDDADAGENPLDLLYTTTVPDLQTIFVRIEDDMTAITGCYSITPYDLVVVRPPAATTPESYEYCDPDADGFGVFNLSSLDPEITGTLSNLIISYHETQSDAFNNINPIIGEYFNVVAYEQTIFVRIQDTTITTDCFSYVDFSIIVNDVPQIELTPDTLEVCDDDFDGFGLFDLSLSNEQILNGLDPLEFEVTYYEVLENAETATSPIATPFSYTNLNPTNHEVYVRVENIISGCYNTVPLPLLVNPLPTIVLPTPLAICDDLVADAFTAFDLTVKNTEITLGDGSLEVVYYRSLLDAESAVNAILDPTSYTNEGIVPAAPNPQTLHVRVTDLDTGCYDLTTLTIRVLPNPTPSPDPVDLELCDEISSGDGLEVFDLTVDEVFVLNGELGVSASYYETLEDAEAGENAITTPEAYTNIETPLQLIYVRVTNDLTGCYTLVDFNIIVHPLPQANVVSDLIACELDTDDIFDFDLEGQTALILGGQDPSIFEVTYHTSLLDAETGLNFLGSPYTNISDPEIIFVSVVNTDTGCRNTELQFNLEVHEAAQAFAPLEFYVLCDDNVETDGDPSNDSVEFDLSVQDAFVLDGQDPLNYTVSYYATQADADQGINALPTLYQNTVNPQVIIARVDNDIQELDDTGTLVDSSICYATALLTLNVDPLPIVLIETDYILCVDTNGTEVLAPLEIETDLSSDDYTFIWSDATGAVVGTGSSYAPSQGGTYSLEVFDATLQTQCAAPVEVFSVIESAPPILTAQVTTAAFASTHVIEALATGQGIYEYSLDQGPWGDSGVFVDVTPGEHVVTARDLNGCGETQVVVYVIDYPLYFTPNGDGYNDTWNIVGVANQNNAKILIFDRFGKLLKQISPSGEGWDGTFNGAQLPSSDYWFTLDYTDPTTGNPQVLRAHFSLKR